MDEIKSFVFGGTYYLPCAMSERQNYVLLVQRIPVYCASWMKLNLVNEMEDNVVSFDQRVIY